MKRLVFIALLGLTVLCMLSGCVSSEGMAVAQGQQQATLEQGEKVQAADKQMEEQLQSLTERQLVIVFIALLQMDKKPEMSLSSKQAEQILPVVNTAISHGELTQSDRKALLETMSPQQKSLFEDISGQMRKRAMNGKPGPIPGPKLTDEERVALAKDLDERRSAEPKEQGLNGQRKPGPINIPPWDFEPDKNVEQQLVELLKSKLNQ